MKKCFWCGYLALSHVLVLVQVDCSECNALDVIYLCPLCALDHLEAAGFEAWASMHFDELDNFDDHHGRTWVT
jgi:hypothetical protein